MASATLPSQINTMRLGEAAIVIASLLFLWGIMWDGRHLLKRSKRSEMRVGRACTGDAWMPLCEALHYLVYETQWAEDQHQPHNEDEFNALVTGQVRVRLARNEVSSRGKLGLSAVGLTRATEPILTKFWVDAFFQPYGEIVLANPDRCAATANGGGMSYHAIILPKEQIEIVWPRRATSNSQLTPLAQFIEPVRAQIEHEKAVGRSQT